jgi:hypothetical protein
MHFDKALYLWRDNIRKESLRRIVLPIYLRFEDNLGEEKCGGKGGGEGETQK